MNERLEVILNDLPYSIRHSGELEDLKEYTREQTERAQELEQKVRVDSELFDKQVQQNKRYRERFREILTEEYGSEGLDAERELERVCEIALEALEEETDE